MSPEQVQEVMGSPTGQASYPTAKTFNPYNFGNDSGNRVEYKYKGQGRVVFAVPQLWRKHEGGARRLRPDRRRQLSFGPPRSDEHAADPRLGEDASREAISIGLASLSVADVVAVARDGARLELERDPAYRARLEAGRRALETALRKGVAVYGVTTGRGRVAGPRGAPSPTASSSRRTCCASTAAARAASSMARSPPRSWWRGSPRSRAVIRRVRPVVLERLCELANRRILPRIPEEGSVGASGDLTPLSYVAALLVGEREALVRGEVVEAADALARAGLEPLALEPKESLALMNGTSVMTALACLAVERAARLARWACTLTAMTVRAIAGNPRHFDRAIFELKPHPGTRRAARVDPRGPRAGRGARSPRACRTSTRCAARRT